MAIMFRDTFLQHFSCESTRWDAPAPCRLARHRLCGTYGTLEFIIGYFPTGTRHLLSRASPTEPARLRQSDEEEEEEEAPSSWS